MKEKENISEKFLRIHRLEISQHLADEKKRNTQTTWLWLSLNQEAEVLPLRVATGIRDFHPALILLLLKSQPSARVWGRGQTGWGQFCLEPYKVQINKNSVLKQLSRTNANNLIMNSISEEGHETAVVINGLCHINLVWHQDRKEFFQKRRKMNLWRSKISIKGQFHVRINQHSCPMITILLNTLQKGQALWHLCKSNSTERKYMISFVVYLTWLITDYQKNASVFKLNKRCVISWVSQRFRLLNHVNSLEVTKSNTASRVDRCHHSCHLKA